MRKLFAALAVAAVLLGIAPMVLHARPASPTTARLSTGLVAALRDAPEDERLGVLVHGASKQSALDAIDAAGLEVVVVLESIGVPAAIGTPDQIAALSTQPGVSYVEADAELEFLLDTALHATRTDEAHAATFDTDCQTTTTEGGPAHGHSQGNGRGRGNEEPTTTTSCTEVGPFSGAGQSIAVIDSGVDGTHPMFQRADGTSKVVRNMKVACIEGVVWFNDNPTTEEENDRVPGNLCNAAGEGTDAFLVDVPTNDSDTVSAGGHGTHVAGIAAGFPTELGDGRTISGTAPGADLVAISVGAGISVLSADIALDWIARNHANPCASLGGTCNPITVVNNSFGPDGGGEFDPESATAKITERLIADGVVVVWANGNGLLSDTSAQPGGDGTENRSNPEGQNPLPGVISVANYDDGDSGTREGSLAPSSSRGDATRPETWPDVSAPGSNITSACRPYLPVCSSSEPDPDYGTIGGTSMAAPHVAGITTLLREANPSITPAQIEQALEDTAHRFQFGAPYWTQADDANPESPTSYDKGHGLVDTMAALGAVLDATVPAAPPSQSACTVPLVIDEEGDATEVFGDPVPPGPQPSEPQLDIRSADLAWDAATETFTFTATATDLQETNPAASTGITYELGFTHDGKSLFIRVTRDATGAVTATLGEFGTGTPTTHVRGLAASVDPATETVTASVTNAQIAAVTGTPVKTFASGDKLSAITVTARRNVSVPSNPAGVSPGLVLPADDAGASCPFTIGGSSTGGEPTPAPEPQPFPRDEDPDPGTDPEPTGPDATIADGETFEATVTTTTDTFGVPQVDAGYECTGPDDPTCFTFRVEAVPGAAGSTLNVYLDPAIDQAALEDWDVRLFDAAGEEIDAGWNGAPTHGGPQTATELWGAFVEVPTTAVYTIVLQPYYAFEGSPMTVFADLVASA